MASCSLLSWAALHIFLDSSRRFECFFEFFMNENQMRTKIAYVIMRSMLEQNTLWHEVIIFQTFEFFSTEVTIPILM